MIIVVRILLILIALAVIGVVVTFAWARTAARPTNLGVTNGQLLPCPDSPNCVTTQSGSADQVMEPLTYSTTQEEAQARIVQIVEELPRSRIVINEPGYIAVESRSPTFGFPDDTEFFLDDANKLIHFRAAARLGRSDMNVNRERMEDISARFRATE